MEDVILCVISKFQLLLCSAQSSNLLINKMNTQLSSPNNRQIENGSYQPIHFISSSSCKKSDQESLGFNDHEEDKRLMELQGQCRIDNSSIQLLRINYIKAVFTFFLLAITIIGLFLLKYYKKVRSYAFYTKLSESQMDVASHIYIKGSDHNEEICEITKKIVDKSSKNIVQFKKLKYVISFRENGIIAIPLGWRHKDILKFWKQEEKVKQGLSSRESQNNEQIYGRNIHQVEVPGYFQYIFDVMTKPFFLFQYLVSIIYILENVAVFGVLMIFFGFFTTTVNYFLLKNSYARIKQTAEKQYDVRVLRQGNQRIIKNTEIVPGDIYIPDNEIPCDSIVWTGQLFVNQVNLTGQTVPIAKFKLNDESKIRESAHWLFEGSLVETKRDGTLAQAVHVGFSSRRGRIIRKILTKQAKQPEFFKKLIHFLIVVLIVSVVIFVATLNPLLELDIEPIMVVFRFCDFITYSFPAPFPIFFNLAYSFCLVRLKRDDIIGTECQKTVEGSRLKTICFDKTGTLTENKMKISKIIRFGNRRESQSSASDIINELQSYPIIENLFACCHSVEIINKQHKGDQIDLRMFQISGATFKQSQAIETVRQVQLNGRKLQILRINQYQSQFQSMSVLVRDSKTKQIFVFVKGSPEMLHSNAKERIMDFDKIVKKLSLDGFRSIAFGYRKINEKEVSHLTEAKRDEFMYGISVLGLAAFINDLKRDAKSTIEALTQAEINSKIITGDNIFLGVQTALKTGMIKPNIKVAVLEGRRFKTTPIILTVLQMANNGQFTESEELNKDFAFQDQDDLVYAVDNDFIQLRPNDFMHDKVKVFARITPQNKALIVRKHKQRMIKDAQKESCWQKMTCEMRVKVGMVGDGANDLIAIKEADVGVGVSSSDAVYSASFAVNNLSQIINIIQEGKNTERQIIEMVQYFLPIQFMSIVITLILTNDSSYFTSMQQIYKSFAHSLLLTLFMGLSRPSKKLIKHMPNSNFMGLENLLVFWGNIIIFTVGFVVGYQYYIRTDDFVANSQTKVTFSNGWNGYNKSSTVCFLMANIMYIMLGVLVYRSSPWKERIWKNIPLSILIIVNLIAIVAIYYLTASLSFLNLQNIRINCASVILGIMAATCAVSWAFNFTIEASKLHEKVDDLSEKERISTQNENVGINFKVNQ